MTLAPDIRQLAQLGVRANGVGVLTLNRPDRGNSLTPDLIRAIQSALDQAQGLHTLVLTGAGRAFSSGGDVAEFARRTDDHDALRNYADALVGALNDLILRLNALPMITLAAVNGPVTGGSLGLMLVCDDVVMKSTAFIQPYYARMGFAPDGGWTALLPGRIGQGRTQRWIARDDRLEAEALLDLGLVGAIAGPGDYVAEVDARIHALTALDPAAISAARQLICPQDDLRAALERERRAFLERITADETRIRMQRFLSGAVEE